jgi:SH3-like domain-containing protein
MKLTVLLIFFSLALLRAETLAAGDEYGIVLKPATFWIGPPDKENAMAFLRIPQGTQVRIIEEEGDYYRINHKDLIGYVERKLVQKLDENGAAKETPAPVNPPIPSPSHTSPFYLVTTATSLRDSPDSQASVLLRLPPEGRVELLEKTDKYWWKVRYKEKTGWAKAALLNAE